MNPTLHIIRKDLRFNRWALLLWLAAIITHFTLRCIQIKDPSWGGSALATSSRWDHLLLFALPLIIIPFLMQADAVRKRYAFWQSLPISRTRLLLAKAITLISVFILLPLAFEITYYFLAGLESVLWNSLKIWLFLHVPLVYISYFLCYLSPGWKSYFCLMLPVAAIVLISTQRILLGDPEKKIARITNTFSESKITTMPTGSTAVVDTSAARLNVESEIEDYPTTPQSQTVEIDIQPVFELKIDNLPANIVIDHFSGSLEIPLGRETLHPDFYVLPDSEPHNGEYSNLAPFTEFFFQQSIAQKPNQPHSHRYECVVDKPIKVDYNLIPDSGLIVEGKLLVNLSEKITLADLPMENNAQWNHRNHKVRLSLTTNSPEYSFVQGELDLYAVFTDDNIFENYQMEFPDRGLFIVAENVQVAQRSFEMHYSADDFMKRQRSGMDISRYLKTKNSRFHFENYNPSNWNIRGTIAISRFAPQREDITSWRAKVITYAPIGTVEIPVNITIPKSETLRRPLDDSKINQFPPLSLEEQIESIEYDDEKQAFADLHRLIGTAWNPSQVSSIEHVIYPALTKIFNKNPELLMKELRINCIQRVTSVNERTSNNNYHWHDYALEINPFWQRVKDFLTTAVKPEHKDLILRQLHPILDQSDLLERMGWEEEAVPILAKIFQQERMPQFWREFLSRHPSEETHKAAMKQLDFSTPRLSRVLQWIDSIDDEKTNMEIVNKVWQQTTLHCDTQDSVRLPLLIALKHGNANVLNDIPLAIQDIEPGYSDEDKMNIEKQRLGIYQSLALFSDCPPEHIKGQEWLSKNSDKLKWNPSNSRYEINPQSATHKDQYDEAKWGKRINPLGVGAFDASLEKDQIRVTASAYPVDYGNSSLERYAPRMMQEITGDFTAEVTVTPLFSASPSWSGKVEEIFQASGLVLEAGETNHLKIATVLHGAKLKNHIRSYITRSDNYVYSNIENNRFDSKKSITLRISRHGDEFTTAWKQEGLDWQESPSQLCRHWPQKLQVGLYVSNLCVKPFSAVFTDFEIKNSSEPPMRYGIAKQPLAENSLPDGSDIPQWGRLDSPFNSGLFEAKDNSLRMNLLPKINDYNFFSVLVAPVTVYRVKGDFVQEVTVAPIQKAKWFGQYLYFRNGNSQMFRFGPAWDSKALFDIHASGFNYSFYTPPCTFQADFTRPMRLRLRREGQLFYAAVKQGELDWQEMAPFYLNCAEELEVGVTALNTSDRPLEAIFTDYSLKTQP